MIGGGRYRTQSRQTADCWATLLEYECECGVVSEAQKSDSVELVQARGAAEVAAATVVQYYSAQPLRRI